MQALEIVGIGHDKPAMQKLILNIKGQIEAGSTLHESLAKHPLYFDDLFVNLVEAGEQAGALETLLEKIATYKEKTEALKKKIKATPKGPKRREMKRVRRQMPRITEEYARGITEMVDPNTGQRVQDDRYGELVEQGFNPSRRPCSFPIIPRRGCVNDSIAASRR